MGRDEQAHLSTICFASIQTRQSRIMRPAMPFQSSYATHTFTSIHTHIHNQPTYTYLQRLQVVLRLVVLLLQAPHLLPELLHPAPYQPSHDKAMCVRFKESETCKGSGSITVVVGSRWMALTYIVDVERQLKQQHHASLSSIESFPPHSLPCLDPFLPSQITQQTAAPIPNRSGEEKCTHRSSTSRCSRTLARYCSSTCARSTSILPACVCDGTRHACKGKRRSSTSERCGWLLCPIDRCPLIDSPSCFLNQPPTPLKEWDKRMHRTSNTEGFTHLGETQRACSTTVDPPPDSQSRRSVRTRLVC